jgi:leader peptidase (prepilin peptidase)/N-methyltransferase
MTALLVTFITVLGALIGSFLNVVVYRVPLGRSVVSPPSACPSCGQAIRSVDNIPVLSWLLLRGRCRECRARISVRYPLVEAGTALAFGVVGAVLIGPVPTASTPALRASAIIVLVAYLYLASVSIALALIDIDTHRLPNVIVLPSYLVAAVLLTAAALLAGNPATLLTAALGGLALGGVYLVLALVYPGGMGMGDVKLAGVLGMFLGFLGWPQVAVGFFTAFLLGGIYAVILLVARRAKRGSGISFGPWMLAGAWLAIFFGAGVFASYLSLFRLGDA